MGRHIAAKTIHWRLFLVLFIFSVLGLAIIGRLFTLQIIRHREFKEAQAKQEGVNGILPRRGTIYFQNREGKLQAAGINKNLYTVIASPKDIVDPALTAAELAPILAMPAEELAKKLSGTALHRIIARKLEETAALKVQNLKIKGIGMIGESRRIYPSASMAAHVLGFVKFESDVETGQYGIERVYEEALRGTAGILDGVEQSGGLFSSLSRRITNPSPNGKDVLLTVDFNIQREAEARLFELMEKWGAESGTATVVDPMTGKILALAAFPAFDPNNPGGVASLSHFLNPIVEANYELGSVMKPVTMAAALNEGVITPETKYEDSGEMRIKGSTIKNYDGKANGVQTMTQVLEKSLNTGAVFAERELGHEKFLEYLKKFGFGERTEVDLPGEVRGNISNLIYDREIEFATASFGQGIAVSPLQMIMAASAIANGGNLMRPYIVEKVRDEAGVEEMTSPEVRRRVITPSASEAVSKMLVSVTRHGFDNRANVKGYFVAGKTGTAQIPNQNGKGYSDEVIHSFVGYAPAFKPKFLIFLQLNRPKGVNFASASLTPAFHDLAAYILRYYDVPPDEP